MRFAMILMCFSIFLVSCDDMLSCPPPNDTIYSRPLPIPKKVAKEPEAETATKSEVKKEVKNVEPEKKKPIQEVKYRDRYIVVIEMREEHFTLDIETHIKDAYNAIRIEIPVDVDFYNSVSVGTVLNDDFKTASFILKGNIGNWSVKIVEKRIEKVKI